MKISNVFARSLPTMLSKLNKSAARIRCPVDDTGTNSVKPSTTPNKAATRIRACSLKKLGILSVRWQSEAP